MKWISDCMLHRNRSLLVAAVCCAFVAAGPNVRLRAEETSEEGEDWSTRLAQRIPGIPIPREEEIIYPDGSRQWLVQCSKYDAPAITGLHRQLWAFFRQGYIRNTSRAGGAFLRVVTDVDYCTPVPYSEDRLAAFDTSWSARVALTYVFYLTRTHKFGIEMEGGKGEILNGVRTSALRRRVDAYVDWDAKARTLYVTVSDFDNPRDTGIQSESGPYYVIGRSVESTISRAYSINSSITRTVPKKEESEPETKISISASTYVQDSKKRLRVTVNGASYYAEFGRFMATEYWHSDGQRRMEFSFGANWTSDADIEYNEVASRAHVECISQKKFDFGLSFIDFLTGASLSGSGSIDCVTDSRQLAVRVSWTAKPTLDHEFDELEGLLTKARFLTTWDDVSGGTCWYQPRFSSTMTWRLHAYPTEQSGAVIDVENGATGPKETKAFYIRRW